MLEQIYFHIGTGKAGSSSVQQFLRKNRRALRARRIVVPEVCGPRRHFNLMHISTSAENVRRYYEQGAVPGELQFASAEEFTLALKEQIRDSGARAAVFSEESMALSAEDDGIARIAAFMHSLARHTIVVCYLRRQDLALMSHFQQAIRYGHVIDLPEFVCTNSSRFDYHERLRPWVQEFGVENIRIVPFERESFHRGDLIEDFAGHLGLADDATFDKTVPVINTSLGAAQLEMLTRINARFPRVPGENRSQFRKTVLKLLRETPDPGKPALPGEMARDVLASFEESNSKVALEWLGRKDGALFRAPLQDSKPVFGSALDVESVCAVLMTTLQFMHDQVDLPRNRPKRKQGAGGGRAKPSADPAA